ncbi:MAG: hypothetical protein GKR92_07895 [Gammaproteobacteria bacterium]|nr:MAG: hypothetical protein GKR92_07895 [Gammaproteobacteria bacterium]
MHPVLIYAVVFIATTIGLLFVFENYQLGSIYLLLLISSIFTAVVGKALARLFPSEDPMQDEIEKEDLKVRANQYQREIRCLFNIVQPDPKFQPSPKRLGESLNECFDLSVDEMNVRLKLYFGDSFNIDINQPLPDMVEEMKQQYKSWLS